MRIFECPACHSPVWFDNLQCQCGTLLGYDPDCDAMVAQFDACANRPGIACNWVSGEPGGLCRSCAMTRTYPDVALEENRTLWTRAEKAKRWVLANLGRLGWFAADNEGDRPVFDLLSEQTAAGARKTIMGHDDGLITINVTEADPAEIMSRREKMGEPYRTMIGHFRHELAHFLFLRLAADDGFLERFRAMFGDERADYEAALDAYHGSDDEGTWQQAHISRYASSHPHEDWAETAAHALHLADLLDSARAVGLAQRASGDDLADALDLGLALNHVNRSMGMEDVYPFVVSPTVREKLEFALSELALREKQAGLRTRQAS